MRMRLLLDANLPHDLRYHFAGHHVETARYAGLNNLDDGPLLDAMAGQFDILITADTSISYQQNVAGRSLSVIVMRARSNRLADLLPLMPKVLSTLKNVRLGEVFEITL